MNNSKGGVASRFGFVRSKPGGKNGGAKKAGPGPDIVVPDSTSSERPTAAPQQQTKSRLAQPGRSSSSSLSRFGFRSSSRQPSQQPTTSSLQPQTTSGDKKVDQQPGSPRSQNQRSPRSHQRSTKMLTSTSSFSRLSRRPSPTSAASVGNNTRVAVSANSEVAKSSAKSCQPRLAASLDRHSTAGSRAARQTNQQPVGAGPGRAGQTLKPRDSSQGPKAGVGDAVSGSISAPTSSQTKLVPASQHQFARPRHPDEVSQKIDWLQVNPGGSTQRAALDGQRDELNSRAHPQTIVNGSCAISNKSDKDECKESAAESGESVPASPSMSTTLSTPAGLSSLARIGLEKPVISPPNDASKLLPPSPLGTSGSQLPGMRASFFANKSSPPVANAAPVNLVSTRRSSESPSAQQSATTESTSQQRFGFSGHRAAIQPPPDKQGDSASSHVQSLDKVGPLNSATLRQSGHRLLGVNPLTAAASDAADEEKADAEDANRRLPSGSNQDAVQGGQQQPARRAFASRLRKSPSPGPSVSAISTGGGDAHAEFSGGTAALQQLIQTQRSVLKERQMQQAATVQDQGAMGGDNTSTEAVQQRLTAAGKRFSLVEEEEDEVDSLISVEESDLIVLRQNGGQLEKAEIGNSENAESLKKPRDIGQQEIKDKEDILARIAGLGDLNQNTSIPTTFRQRNNQDGSKATARRWVRNWTPPGATPSDSTVSTESNRSAADCLEQLKQSTKTILDQHRIGGIRTNPFLSSSRGGQGRGIRSFAKQDPSIRTSASNISSTKSDELSIFEAGEIVELDSSIISTGSMICQDTQPGPLEGILTNNNMRSQQASSFNKNRKDGGKEDIISIDERRWKEADQPVVNNQQLLVGSYPAPACRDSSTSSSMVASTNYTSRLMSKARQSSGPSIGSGGHDERPTVGNPFNGSRVVQSLPPDWQKFFGGSPVSGTAQTRHSWGPAKAFRDPIDNQQKSSSTNTGATTGSELEGVTGSSSRAAANTMALVNKLMMTSQTTKSNTMEEENLNNNVMIGSTNNFSSDGVDDMCSSRETSPMELLQDEIHSLHGEVAANIKNNNLNESQHESTPSRTRRSPSLELVISPGLVKQHRQRFESSSPSPQQRLKDRLSYGREDDEIELDSTKLSNTDGAQVESAKIARENTSTEKLRRILFAERLSGAGADGCQAVDDPDAADMPAAQMSTSASSAAGSESSAASESVADFLLHSKADVGTSVELKAAVSDDKLGKFHHNSNKFARSEDAKMTERKTSEDNSVHLQLDLIKDSGYVASSSLSSSSCMTESRSGPLAPIASRGPDQQQPALPKADEPPQQQQSTVAPSPGSSTTSSLGCSMTSSDGLGGPGLVQAKDSCGHRHDHHQHHLRSDFLIDDDYTDQPELMLDSHNSRSERAPAQHDDCSSIEESIFDAVDSLLAAKEHEEKNEEKKVKQADRLEPKTLDDFETKVHVADRKGLDENVDNSTEDRQSSLALGGAMTVRFKDDELISIKEERENSQSPPNPGKTDLETAKEPRIHQNEAVDSPKRLGQSEADSPKRPKEEDGGGEAPASADGLDPPISSNSSYSPMSSSSRNAGKGLMLPPPSILGSSSAQNSPRHNRSLRRKRSLPSAGTGALEDIQNRMRRSRQASQASVDTLSGMDLESLASDDCILDFELRSEDEDGSYCEDFQEDNQLPDSDRNRSLSPLAARTGLSEVGGKVVVPPGVPGNNMASAATSTKHIPSDLRGTTGTRSNYMGAGGNLTYPRYHTSGEVPTGEAGRTRQASTSLSRSSSITSDEGVILDRSMYNSINEDVVEVKTLLLQLKRVLQEGCNENLEQVLQLTGLVGGADFADPSQPQPPGAGQHRNRYTSATDQEITELEQGLGFEEDNKLVLGRTPPTSTSPTSSTTSGEEKCKLELVSRTDLIRENADLKKQLAKLQQQMAERERQLSLLVDGGKHAQRHLSQKSDTVNDRSLVRKNAATQTERSRPPSTNIGVSSNEDGLISPSSESVSMMYPHHNSSSPVWKPPVTPGTRHTAHLASHARNNLPNPLQPASNLTPNHSSSSSTQMRATAREARTRRPTSTGQDSSSGRTNNIWLPPGHYHRSPSGGRHTARRAESPRHHRLCTKSSMSSSNLLSCSQTSINSNNVNNRSTHNLSQTSTSGGAGQPSIRQSWLNSFLHQDQQYNYKQYSGGLDSGYSDNSFNSTNITRAVSVGRINGGSGGNHGGHHPRGYTPPRMSRLPVQTMHH